MLDTKEERLHFSYSQLATMLSCPYKYRLQYIEGRRWDYIPSAVSFGKAIHNSLQMFHRDLLFRRASGNGKYAGEFGKTFVTDTDENNVVFKDSDEFNILMERGETLINQYVRDFSHLNPFTVEMEFRLPLVNSYTGDLHSKDVVGRMDLITEGEKVYEFKTTSSSIPESAVDENLQLILYGWAYKLLYGKNPEKLVLVNLIKTKKPKIQVLETVINPEKEKKLLHLMFKVNEAMEKQVFYPNPRGGFGCSSCSYSMTCEYAM